MEQIISSFWQFNLEASILLLGILLARLALRSTAKVYNCYLLWLSIPVVVAISKVISNIQFERNDTIQVVETVVRDYVVLPSSQLSHSPSQSWLGWLWIAVVITLLLRLLGQHLQLRRDLAVLDQPVHQNLTSIPIFEVQDRRFSPSVYGFLRPKIFFPQHLFHELSRDQIELIIRHEEQHVKQGHLWLNLLWDISVCVMWFNPLIYIARQSFRHDQELYCDYLVLNKSESQEQAAYGHALLTTVSATHSVSLLCSWKTFNQLEERIMNIKAFNPQRTKVLIALVASVLFAGTATYSVATAHDLKEGKTVKKIFKLDSDVKTNMVITEGGKTMVMEDGEYYVKEDDKKRPMSEEELATFKRLSEEHKIEEMILKGMGESKVVIKRMPGAHISELDIDIDGLDELSALDIDDFPIEFLETEFIDGHAFSFGFLDGPAEHSVERAIAELDALKELKKLDEKEIEKARAKLEKIHKDLEKERQKLREAQKKAREEVRKLREELTEKPSIPSSAH